MIDFQRLRPVVVGPPTVDKNARGCVHAQFHSERYIRGDLWP